VDTDDTFLHFICMRLPPALPIAVLPDDVGVLQELVRGLLASHQAERQRNTELQERSTS
jgi:hypothetical protein